MKETTKCSFKTPATERYELQQDGLIKTQAGEESDEELGTVYCIRQGGGGGSSALDRTSGCS